MGRDLARHPLHLLENAVSAPSLKTASTPAETPRAWSSEPFAASRLAQKEMSSFSTLLYRRTVRSREKSVEAARFSSVTPVMTVRDSKRSHNRLSPQSRRVPTPSHHLSSGCFGTLPHRLPMSFFSGVQRSSAGSDGANRSVLRRRMSVSPCLAARARERASRRSPRTGLSYRRRRSSIAWRSNSLIPWLGMRSAHHCQRRKQHARLSAGRQDLNVRSFYCRDNFGLAADVAVHPAAHGGHGRQFQSIEPHNRKTATTAGFGRGRPDVALGGEGLQRGHVQIFQQSNEVAQRFIEILDHDQTAINNFGRRFGQEIRDFSGEADPRRDAARTTRRETVRLSPGLPQAYP